jgi:MOSC domain-containing protein YiiM
MGKMEILHIYLSSAHNYYGHHGQPAGREPMKEVTAVECVAGSGLRDDRFFDYKPDYKGQVTFFEIETYERVSAELGVYGKGPHVFRRNIITRGVDLNTLIGQEFEVQGVRFLGTQEAAPCHWMEQAFGEGAERALKGRGGLRAKILTSGLVRSQAAVETGACIG